MSLGKCHSSYTLKEKLIKEQNWEWEINPSTTRNTICQITSQYRKDKNK